MLGSAAPAAAQSQPASGTPRPRVTVIGEGSVSVTPDLAQIHAGATTRAKTVKEASDTNAKAMTAVMAALAELGIAPADIQTARFSIQPVYSQEQGAPQKLVGYSVSNQVGVKIRQLDKVSQVLDRLVVAGATDIGTIEFLVADRSKALDSAREAAIADAKRRAEVYAHAAGIALGPVVWITEGSAVTPPGAYRALEGGSAPISVGENTLQARVTVGFDLAH